MWINFRWIFEGLLQLKIWYKTCMYSPSDCCLVKPNILGFHSNASKASAGKKRHVTYSKWERVYITGVYNTEKGVEKLSSSRVIYTHFEKFYTLVINNFEFFVLLFKRLNLARNLRRKLSSFIDNRFCIRCHSCGIKSGTCFHVILINNCVILVYNYNGWQPYKALQVVYVCHARTCW